MKLPALIAALALVLSGCSTFIPKRVELFQDKVKAFPEPTEKQVEVQKQVIQRAHERAKDTIQAALKEQTSTNVIVPAKDVERLLEVTALSVGPPMSRTSMPAEALARKLEDKIAALENRVQEFKSSNNENTGKKIEGTGIIQVPYFLWTGGTILIVIIVFAIVKLFLSVAALTNPGAALGLGAMKLTQGVVTKGLAQVVKGGEQFKNWVGKEVNDESMKQKILDAFQTAQMKAQDEDVKTTVKAMTG